jgi:hypothetical protein
MQKLIGAIFFRTAGVNVGWVYTPLIAACVARILIILNDAPRQNYSGPVGTNTFALERHNRVSIFV